MKPKSLLIPFLVLSLGLTAPAVFANEQAHAKTDKEHEHKSQKKHKDKSHQADEKKSHGKKSHSHAEEKKGLPELELTSKPSEQGKPKDKKEDKQDKPKNKHQSKHVNKKHKNKHDSDHAAEHQDQHEQKHKQEDKHEHKHENAVKDKQDCVNCPKPKQVDSNKHEAVKKIPVESADELKPKVGFPEAPAAKTVPPTATPQAPVNVTPEQ